MIPEALAKLRGVDKWPTAKATVNSPELGTAYRGDDWNALSFYYRPEGLDLQSGSLKTDSLTSIYGLTVGDTFDIQYNPKNSARFYCRDVNSSTRTFQMIMAPLVVLFVITLILCEIIAAAKHSH
jgi:hypothetical protein